MQVGFGKNKKKAKQKKKQKNKGQTGDATMADAPSSPHPSETAGMEEEDDSSQPTTAKQKLRQRLELKKALKVKVAGLKQARSKLTKMASNKDGKRIISKQLHAIMAEEATRKHKKQSGSPRVAAAGAAAMAE